MRPIALQLQTRPAMIRLPRSLCPAGFFPPRNRAPNCGHRAISAVPREPIVLPPPRLPFLAPRDLGFVPLAALFDVLANIVLQPPVSTAASVAASGAVFSAYKLRERSRERFERAAEGLARARLAHELANDPGLARTLGVAADPPPELQPNADSLFPMVSSTPFRKDELVNGVFQLKGKPFTMEEGLFLVVVSAVQIEAEVQGGKARAIRLAEFAVLRVRDDRSVEKLVVSNGVGDDMFTALL
ncbi:hypothetical protein DFJ74DRAFT_767466 [Hyaloraphidium curvatum]|nr:hypothetical protein DFJ74DRAFT_767466 [Hyaloraphidium curvatum]